MQHAQDQAREQVTQESLPPETEPVPLREAAADVLDTIHRQLAALLELFTLEIQYSGLMFIWAAALAVVVALAAFSVWGLSVSAIVAWLHSSGWSWASALAAMALANGIIVFTSLWLIRRALLRVGINSTRQVLGMDVQNAAE